MGKRLIVFCLAVFFISSSAVFSQDKDKDAAYQLVNDGIKSYQSGSFKEAYDKFISALEIFNTDTTLYEPEITETRLWLGAASFNLGEYEEAERFYRESLGLAEKRKDVNAELKARLALGNLYSTTRKYDISGDEYLKASKLYQSLTFSNESRKTREYAGSMKYMAGDFISAVKIFSDSISEIKTGSIKRSGMETGWLYSSRAVSYYYLADIEKSLADYKSSIKILLELPSGQERDLYLARSYGWAGKIYFESGDTAEAIRTFDLSLDLAQKSKSPDDQALALSYKGFVYASANDYKKGAEFYGKAVEVLEAVPGSPYFSNAIENAAWIYSELEDYGKSIYYYKKLLEYYQNQSQNQPEGGNELKSADTLNLIGVHQYRNGQHDEAINNYAKALKIYEENATEDTSYLENKVTILFNTGMAYDAKGDSVKALEYLQKSLLENIQDYSGYQSFGDKVFFLAEIYQKQFGEKKLDELLEKLFLKASRSKKDQIDLYISFGHINYKLARYSEALRFYNHAVNAARKNNLKKEHAYAVFYTGTATVGLSQFEPTLKAYESALEEARTISDITEKKNLTADIYNNMGELYRKWGWFEKSLFYYKASEKIYRESNNTGGLVSVYNNQGQAVRNMGFPEKSISLYENALSINESLDDLSTKAILLSNLGEAYREAAPVSENADSNYQQALKFYTKALRIDQEMHNVRGVIIRRNNIALIYTYRGEYKKAVESFKECLQFWKKTGDEKGEATALNNLAYAHYFLNEYDKAARYYEESIGIHEKLRSSAAGSIRREYLAAQISVYRDLSMTYFKMGDPWKSLYALESSRAKYLIEQVGEKNPKSGNILPDLKTFKNFQQHLNPYEAMLSVSLVDRNVYQIIVVTPANILTTIATPDVEFLKAFYEKNSRRIKRVADVDQDNIFNAVITYYRYLLSRPVSSERDKEQIRELAGYFYKLWIAPLESYQSYMKNITALTIIPDGILGTIPFETLRDEKNAGKYLIEKYDVSYAHSVTISEINNQRNYDKNRKPLLAFGGAVYNSSKSKDEIEQTRGHSGSGNRNGVREQADEKMSRGASLRAVYSEMGYNEWANLPGSLNEVSQLSEIVKGAEVKTGGEVTEKYVKELSMKRKLEGYRVLHFATHGVVIPEVPELSAIVLSLQQSPKEAADSNDGYLTMKEISELDIKADFVNLSACETGLGKVYEGEGVVGLTQAFLVAGAKSLSVSLWQVSDESTMKFMTGLYELVEEQGISYSKAMSDMKRKFIKTKQWNDPFYWAPFVYYGK